jgi:hypothetical protein
MAVRQVILTLLPHGNSAIHQIAQGVGTSVRALQRRLAEAGINHSQLVDEARWCHLDAR